MVIIWCVTYESKDIKMKFFCIVKMGKKLPSGINPGSFYPKGCNKIFDLWRWSDSKDIKKKKKGKNRDKEHFISKKEDNKNQKQGKRNVKT